MGPRALLLSLGTWCLLALLAPAGAAQHTTVHLEKEDALAHVFPEADQVLQLKCLLTDEETASIEKRAGRRLDEGGFYCFVALKGGEPQGYAVIVSQIGKVKPITHIVAAKPDGTVFDASSISGADCRLQTQSALFVDLDNTYAAHRTASSRVADCTSIW